MNESSRQNEYSGTPSHGIQQVLLLNASYEPLNICSWKRAVVLLMKGKAVEVEESTAHHTVHTSSKNQTAMVLPLVIRLLYYVKIPHKDIPLTRKNLMHRDNYQCQYCNKTNTLTIDHVMPRSRGGKNTWDNVVIACLTCNVKKGCRTPEEANMPLKRKPRRPKDFMNFEISKQKVSRPTHLPVWLPFLKKA